MAEKDGLQQAIDDAEATGDDEEYIAALKRLLKYRPALYKRAEALSSLDKIDDRGVIVGVKKQDD